MHTQTHTQSRMSSTSFMSSGYKMLLKAQLQSGFQFKVVFFPSFPLVVMAGVLLSFPSLPLICFVLCFLYNFYELFPTLCTASLTCLALVASRKLFFLSQHRDSLSLWVQRRRRQLSVFLLHHSLYSSALKNNFQYLLLFLSFSIFLTSSQETAHSY